MSINTTEGIQSFPHDESRTVSEITESFTKAIDAPEEAIEPFAELVGDMAQTIEQQSEELSALREEKRELEGELKEERETRAKEAAQDRKRITEIEERLDSVEEGGSSDTNPTPQGQETPLHESETPLEEIVQLPEHLAEENLSANQQRARFAAKGIHEYSRSVQAGRVIKSSELRRVLSAGEEERVYTQTVSRVIDFLTDLGQDDVNLRETQAGERVVVFTDEIVKRIVASHNRSNGVVTEGGATG